MLAEIKSETLKLDLIDIGYRTFYDQNNRLNEKIHLFRNENLHDRILEDRQLNSFIERLMNIVELCAGVISNEIPEGHIVGDN